MHTTSDRVILEAALAASKAFTASIEQALGKSEPNPRERIHPPADIEASADLPVWDPLTDAPLVQPKVQGTDDEINWCCLTYLGAVWATNVREDRGANRDEIKEFAVRAGYRDGRAVTAWSKGNGATRNDDDKLRWMTPNGKAWTQGYATKCGVRLPDDVVADMDV